jgi:hypothetical protein
MSGSPTEAEIQTQWRRSIALLEGMRNYADGTIAGAGNQLDLLMQSLEGEFTPAGVASAAQSWRSNLSTLIDRSRVQQFLTPIIYEYARFAGIAGSSPQQIMPRLYDHFIANSLSVKSRAITFDAVATAGAGNVGTGNIYRLTVDENNMPLEDVTVETKEFRCIADQATGAFKWAETFEVRGGAASQDALQRPSTGSGLIARNIRASHAGSGSGGSLLRNSSFSQFSATGTPKFAGWDEVSGGAAIQQDTANIYRSHPNSTLDASLRINGGSGTVTLRQPIGQMAISQVNPDVPYLYRVMVNKTIGTAAGGNVVIRMGSQSTTISIAALGSGWQEITIAAGQNCWFQNFNDGAFDVEIEWNGSTSGYLLVDDAIFTAWTYLDGSYWNIRNVEASPASWALDDTMTFTDAGGAPATGKIQWWLWIAGWGYLPTHGTPTFADP